MRALTNWCSPTSIGKVRRRVGGSGVGTDLARIGTEDCWSALCEASPYLAGHIV